MGEPIQWMEGKHYATGESIRVEIRDGRITEVKPTDQPRRGEDPVLAPGLVDLQVNGYGGFDLNTVPLSEGTVAFVTRALWEEGVTTCLPTVITNSSDDIRELMRVIAHAADADVMMRRMIAGIHLEGPYISPEDGARGAHPREHVTAPSWEQFQRWQDAANGLIRIVTLSPEWPEAIPFIERCRASGVIVSIGHTAASPEQIRAAVAAGASCSTHLGNGSHPMLHRHHNYLWEQLAADDLWGCFIADGFHLPDAPQKIILRMKGDRAIVVSDAVHFAGMAPGFYEAHIGGGVVKTTEGKLHLADHPEILAGSAQPLLFGLNRLMRTGLASLERAWGLGSKNPARLLGLATAEGILPGRPANLVELEGPPGNLRVTRTVLHGEEVYAANNSERGGQPKDSGSKRK